MVNDGGLFVRLDSKDVAQAVDLSIRQAVVDHLGKDPIAVVRAVVDAALESSRPGYPSSTPGQRTAFQTAVDRLIREEAEAAVKTVLEELRPAIAESLRTRLRATFSADNLAEDLTAKLLETLEAGLFVNATVQVYRHGSSDTDL